MSSDHESLRKQEIEDRLDNLDKFRFFAIDKIDQRRSDVWFINSVGDNVYLAPRSLGGALKLSLHPPGLSRDGCDSQWGHTGADARAQQAAGFQPMRLMRWRRPPPPKFGAVYVARVLFAPDLLSPCEAVVGENKTKFALPLPDEGSALEVALAYGLEPPGVAETWFLERGITPMFHLDLASGEFVHVTARHVPFAGMSKELLATAQPSPLSGAPAPGEHVDARAIAVLRRTGSDEPLSLVEIGPLTVHRSP